MIIHTLALGPFMTNSYVLGCEQSREAVVIDPGFEPDRLLAKAAQDDLKIVKILLTHGHVDHVSAVGGIKRATGAPIYIHEADREQYLAAPKLGMYFGLQTDEQPAPDHTVAEGDEITFGEQTLKVIHTPGHTPGGVCYHSPSAKILVAGDTLFQRGIGRTDLPGGSMRTLFSSIQGKIYALDGDTRVLSGHGPETTVAEERRSNPFVTA
jgi:glyoxylase-like metal-dependent hydrolase (beta-lactamase superfamily II)